MAAVLAGLLVGIPALRVQSHYLGIVTLGLALAFTALVGNLTIAGGAEGLLGIPVPPLAGVDLSSHYLYYYLEIVVFALCSPFAYFVVYTPFGRRLRAMRDDSLAAASTGVEVPLARMASFALAGVLRRDRRCPLRGPGALRRPDRRSTSTRCSCCSRWSSSAGGSASPARWSASIALTVVREELSDYASVRAVRLRRR